MIQKNNISQLTQRLKTVLYFCIVLFFFSLTVQNCDEKRKLKTALEASQKETTHFKNSLGKLTASHEVLVYQSKKQLKESIEKDKELTAMTKEFTKVKATIKIITKTKFDTIRESFEVPVPCEFERTGMIENDWYELGYKVNEKGLEIEPFVTWSDINVVTGFKRKWFLGKQTYTTDVTATNPYIEIPEIQQKEVEVPVKWYETTLFKVGIGILGGVLIAK